MKDYTKGNAAGSPAVRQKRGPGMNLGLKKPRKTMAQPKNYGKPRAARAAGPAFTNSYLPDTLGLGRKKSKP